MYVCLFDGFVLHMYKSKYDIKQSKYKIGDRGKAASCNPAGPVIRNREERKFNLSVNPNYKSRNKGLISVDRRTKPTLILTIPRSLFKSSTKDLSSAIFEIVIQSYDLGRQAPIRIRFRSRKVDIDGFQHGF